MKQLKLALLGFGNVGQAFARLMMSKADKIENKYGRTPIVTAIATNTKGNLINSRGIDLQKALEDIEKTGRFQNDVDLMSDAAKYGDCKNAGGTEESLSELITMDIVKSADYDVLIELTPLNIKTGQPAISHIDEAIARGKHVVTANKGPIAWDFKRLNKLAQDAGVGFFYETTVMDGAPVFNMAEQNLMLSEVREVSGILNTTTNFILEEMAKGTPHEEIMARGRKMGFIEADPAMDIEGYDAAAKITALMNVLMDADMTPDMVDRKGIEDITEEDVNDAAARGKVIKLICTGKLDESGKPYAQVKPKEVEKTDMLASVNSTTSVVSITTDVMRKLTITEHEPEIEQTAYGVFGDMLRVFEFVK